MADANELKGYLENSPLSPSARHDTWNAYADATDPQDFQQRMKELNLPEATAKTLAQMKFREPAGTPPQKFGPGAGESNIGYPQGDLSWKDVKAMGVEALPAAGGVVGSVFGGIPGAAAGGAAGEAGRQAIVSRVGEKELSTPLVKVRPAGTSFSEVSKDILKSGAEQGAFEIGGRAAAAGMRGAVAGPLHKASMLPGTATKSSNLAVREINKASGLGLTAAEVAGKSIPGRLTGVVQRMGEYSIFSQRYIDEVREAGVEKAMTYIDDVLDNLHAQTSPAATGDAARSALQTSYDLFQDVAGKFYQALDKQAAGTMVNMRPVKTEAARILARSDATKKVAPNSGGLGAKAEGILRDAAGLKDDVDFLTAHDWRKKLGRVTAQGDELVADESKGIAKNVYAELTRAMENSARALNPKALRTWNLARDFYSEGMDLFDVKMVNGMMNTDRGPEMIAKAIKDGDVTTAKRIHDAILKYPMKYGDPGTKDVAKMTWRQFQEQFVRSNILKNPEGETGELAIADVLADSKIIQNRLKKLGKGVIREVFEQDPEGREAIGNIRSIGDAFARIEKLPFEGRRYVYDAMRIAGGLAVGWKAAGAEGAAKSAAIFEGIPLFLSAALYNKKATGYLLDGIGGLLESFEGKGLVSRALNITGKGVEQIQERTVSSPASYKYGGKVMANFLRAANEVRKDQGLIRERAEKAATQIDISHPPDSMPDVPPEKVEANPYR